MGIIDIEYFPGDGGFYIYDKDGSERIWVYNEDMPELLNLIADALSFKDSQDKKKGTN